MSLKMSWFSLSVILTALSPGFCWGGETASRRLRHYLGSINPGREEMISSASFAKARWQRSLALHC